MEILLQLFISFATVGVFCVGGGYASMPPHRENQSSRSMHSLGCLNKRRKTNSDR